MMVEVLFRILVLFAALAIGTSKPALAGVGANPLDPGLPQGWTATVARGFEPVVIGNTTSSDPALKLSTVNSWSSALCVECHSVSPSRFTAAPTSMPAGDTPTMYEGSHFVKNWLDEAWYATAVTAIEKTDAWPSGALSKYGAVGGTASGTGAAGEMICESCHNVLTNGGENLLVGEYDATTGDATLCVSCHASQAAGPPSHHAVTGHQVGPDEENISTHALNVTHYSHVLIPDPALTGGVTFFPAGGPFTTMTCLSCHTPHDAATATGARVLRRGSSTSALSGVTDKSVNVVYYADIPDFGFSPGDVIYRKPSGDSIVTGVHRQLDMDPLTLLVTNQDPLCDSCH